MRQSKAHLKQTLHGIEESEREKAERLAEERRLEQLRKEKAEKKRQEEAERQKQLRIKRAQADALRGNIEEARQAKAAHTQARKDERNRSEQAARDEAEAEMKHDLMHAMAVASKKTLGCILACRKCASYLYGILQVNETRQRLREGRPMHERFRDHVSDAHDSQHELIDASRLELKQYVAHGLAMREEIDRLNLLLQTGRSRDNVVRRFEKSASLPLLPGAPPKTVMAPVFTSSQKSTAALLDEARVLVEDASALIAACPPLLNRLNSVNNEAVAFCDGALERRKNEIEELRNVLAQERKEAIQLVNDARAKITSLTALKDAQGHQSAPAKDLQKAEDVLEHCIACKKLVEDDFSNKTNALRIDVTCRTLTKIRAAGEFFGRVEEPGEGEEEHRPKSGGSAKRSASSPKSGGKASSPKAAEEGKALS